MALVESRITASIRRRIQTGIASWSPEYTQKAIGIRRFRRDTYAADTKKHMAPTTSRTRQNRIPPACFNNSKTESTAHASLYILSNRCFPLHPTATTILGVGASGIRLFNVGAFTTRKRQRYDMDIFVFRCSCCIKDAPT
ncbi:hypothetical protein NCS52_01329700 [Fusarium sp. LHS14.1]|nr:hypothetical protein NCS52_01329700 [Fusarium sp. LHS14.1]